MTLLTEYFSNLPSILPCFNAFEIAGCTPEIRNTWQEFESNSSFSIKIPAYISSKILDTSEMFADRNKPLSLSIDDLGNILAISKIKKEDSKEVTKLFFKTYASTFADYIIDRAHSANEEELKKLEKLTTLLPADHKLPPLKEIAKRYLNYQAYSATQRIINIIQSLHLRVKNRESLMEFFNIGTELYFDMINVALENNDKKIAEKFIRTYYSLNRATAINTFNEKINMQKVTELNILMLPLLGVPRRILRKKKPIPIPQELASFFQSINQLLKNNAREEAEKKISLFLEYNIRKTAFEELESHIDMDRVRLLHIRPDIWPIYHNGSSVESYETYSSDDDD